jgi:hypothetical protein
VDDDQDPNPGLSLPPPLPERTSRNWYESRCDRVAGAHAIRVENVVLPHERQDDIAFEVTLVSDITHTTFDEWVRMYARATQRGSRDAHTADRMINLVESLRHDPTQIVRRRSRQFRTPRTLWHRDRYDPQNVSSWYPEQLTSPPRKLLHEREPDTTFTVWTRIVPHFESPPITYFSSDALTAIWPDPPPPTIIRLVHTFCFHFIARLAVV